MTPPDLVLRKARRVLPMVAAIAVLCATAPSRADVVVVTDTSVSGLPAEAVAIMGRGAVEPGKPVTTTTYYKGDKQRIESRGDIAIFDGDTDTLKTLHPDSHTYTTLSLADVMHRFNTGALHTYLKVDAKSDEFSIQTTGKPIAGQAAHEATFVLGVHEYPDPSIGDTLPIPDATITCLGEWWYADSLPVPPALTAAERTGFLLNFALSGVGALMMGHSLDGIADQIASLKQIPLSSRLEFHYKATDPKAAAESGIPSFNEPILVITDAKSISVAPLDDSLFTVPAGYTAAPGAGPAPVPTPTASSAAAPAPTSK